MYASTVIVFGSARAWFLVVVSVSCRCPFVLVRKRGDKIGIERQRVSEREREKERNGEKIERERERNKENRVCEGQEGWWGWQIKEERARSREEKARERTREEPRSASVLLNDVYYGVGFWRESVW